MDMIVNIALGRGSDDQRIVFLTQIAQKQEMIIEKYGPYNPMVSLGQYRNTLAKIIQLSGFQDPSQFIKEVDPKEVQAFVQQQQQGAKKPDPAQLLAEVEAEKIKADIVINAAKLELERQKAISDADLSRDKLYIDTIIKSAEIKARYNANVDTNALQQEVERQRVDIQDLFMGREALEGMMEPMPQEMPPQMPPDMPPEMPPDMPPEMSPGMPPMEGQVDPEMGFMPPMPPQQGVYK